MSYNNFKEFDLIPKSYVIGRKYHCSWAKSRGYVWILVDFNITSNTATLKTPKTGKVLTTQLNSLRNVNSTIIKDRDKTKQNRKGKPPLKSGKQTFTQSHFNHSDHD